MSAEEHEIDLAPLPARRGGRSPKAAEVEVPSAPNVQALARVLAQAFQSAANETAKPTAPRLPDNEERVAMRANKSFHLSPQHMARADIAGTAYGMDGMSRHVAEGEVFHVWRGPHIDYLIESGFARMDRSAA